MMVYNRNEERTGMQEAAVFDPAYDLQCDFVMVYGFHDLEKRVKQWRNEGYIVHLMTGVSWGSYVDYLDGAFDGEKHWDEGQQEANGNGICHAEDPKVPYMVPTVSFSKYLAENLKKAVDFGVEAIHLEEPEFWIHGGYSEAFKREWQIYYKEPWQDPEASSEGQYRANKLKRYLYTRTLDRLCAELKEYALKKYGRFLRFYVPTHSLVNYTQWRIVSPESALVDLPSIDGYIAQIWTGTSRAINRYRGEVKERTFETAFLEYGAMQELARSTGRNMWYLHDPIEDDPAHTWDDYRYNYYRTLIASLFHPEVGVYEVCPWPSRVMKGRYKPSSTSEKGFMPEEYRTNYIALTHALREMKDLPSRWITDSKEIGVLLADSGMYQRRYPVGDPKKKETDTIEFSSFYGLAMPLMKQGVCVRPVQLDNVRRFAGYLNSYKTLVLSYEFMKPDSPDIHFALSRWVSDGGKLVIVGDGADSFHRVREWWNTTADYATPTEHLCETLGLGRKPENGIYAFGKGHVCIINEDPINIAHCADLCDRYLDNMLSLFRESGEELVFGNSLLMERGEYMIGAVLDETENTDEMQVLGSYVDMLDNRFSVVSDPVLRIGEVGLWKSAKGEGILAASGRVSNLVCSDSGMSFSLRGPSPMTAAVRFKTKDGKAVVSVTKAGEEIPCTVETEEAENTALLTFEMPAGGADVEVKW